MTVWVLWPASEPKGGWSLLNSATFSATLITASVPAHLSKGFRLDADNALVRLESPPGTPVEVVTPYATADLEGIRYTQSADVLYLVHPAYASHRRRRM